MIPLLVCPLGICDSKKRTGNYLWLSTINSAHRTPDCRGSINLFLTGQKDNILQSEYTMYLLVLVFAPGNL